MAGSTIENRGPGLAAVAIALVIAAVVSFCLRAFVRLRMVKSFGVDDWFMLLATITFTVFCTCVITGVHYGTGRHFADLLLANRQRAMECWWFCYVFYAMTMIASKISIGVFLLRITIQRVHIYTIYVAMALSVITGLVFFFVTVFQCRPISYFWDQEQAGSCISVDIIIGLTYLYSSLNIIADFTFALLPCFIVKDLQMDRKLKIALMPLLGMGCIASSAVVVRLAYVESFRDPDFLWATVDIAIWSVTESGIAITAGSLACLRPLFKKMVHTFGWSSSPGGRSTMLPGSMQLPDGPQAGSKGGGQGGGGYAGNRSPGPRDMFSLAEFETRNDGGSDDGEWDSSKVSTRKLILSKGTVSELKQHEVVGPEGGSGQEDDAADARYTRTVIRKADASPV